MAINWKKTELSIEKLAKQNKKDELISELCENYALDIGGILKGLEKGSEDYEYFTKLQKTLGKIQKQFSNNLVKGK